MVDDAGVLQARALLKELNDEVEDISRKLDTIERRHRRTSARGAMLDRRRVAGLRRELYEAHRLIDGLHRRFPATNEVEHPVTREEPDRPRVLVGGRLPDQASLRR